jgi:hypothetical protein
MAKKLDPKAKAKRQKIVAAVLGVVFIGVLAWQVPSLMKTLNKKPPPPATAPAPPPPPAAGAPVAGGPVTGTPVSAPVSSTALADSDPPAQPGSGQLLSFDRFTSKDPFVQQAGTPPAAAPEPAPEAPPPPPPPPPASKPPPAAKPTSAQISVNGESGKVAVGATFPAADPVFRLVSVTKTTAKIAIAGGSLSTGNGTVTLTKGKKLTLMNTADGTRYELVLLSAS